MPQAAWPRCVFSECPKAEEQAEAGEAGASSPGAFSRVNAIVCLKQTGLVPGRCCLHGAAVPFIMVTQGLGARSQLSKALAHGSGVGGLLGAITPGPAPRKMSEKLMSDQTAAAC